jgi:hypothetical protein
MPTIRITDAAVRKLKVPETGRVEYWDSHTRGFGLRISASGVKANYEVCLSAQSAFGGDKLWEEKHPAAAAVLRELAEAHSQQDPTFRTTQSFTRLTAAEALRQLRARGIAEAELPSPSTMAEILNRNSYRLRPVLKAKLQKKSRKPMPSSTLSGPKTNAARVDGSRD